MNIPINYIYAAFENGAHYGNLINWYVNSLLNEIDYFLFFDIDAIPLKQTSIDEIINRIKDKETIWGISQQSAHILKNVSPIQPYAGFSSCGFSKLLYIKLGKPTFDVTYRGDIGEELTWKCKELGYNVCLSYPYKIYGMTEEEAKNSNNPRFGNVDNGIRMGLGTTGRKPGRPVSRPPLRSGKTRARFRRWCAR